ncbi:GDP-L-fucose synthase [bacterium]|nr:GDP-L-fucose synthase [bacterium]MCI0602945.1 GDP-L-fucose synthase [bacterium]
MKQDQRIFVAGASGLVGSAIYRVLKKQGFTQIIVKSRKELDLLDQPQVSQFFLETRPEIVFLCAGKVGGVYANDTYRAEFIYENLQIEANVIHSSYVAEVKKLIFFGSSTMYPKNCPQPMKEQHLMTGLLEPTNEALGMAKLAGMKMCQSYNLQYGTDFITIIPSNLYGINQNYAPLNSMVIPSLIRKFYEAKKGGKNEVIIWGSGRGIRDFLFSDSCAVAAIFLGQNYSGNAPVNVGSGVDTTVQELAEVIKKIVGFEGTIVYDRSKTDGTLIKLLDLTEISEMGWKNQMALEEGIEICYSDFLTRIGKS